MTGAHFRAAAIVLALAAAPVTAQGVPDLVTDRPDQTESAEVVPVGTLQVELGALFTRDETGGERIDVLEGPGSLVRWGLSPRFELRFGWPGWIESEVESAGARHDRSGAGDPELGAKLELAALDAG
ncbi:MAG TPA: hypothetical protein VH741_09800, partial [Candidatus Limnocylindrales bacterium]